MFILTSNCAKLKQLKQNNVMIRFKTQRMALARRTMPFIGYTKKTMWILQEVTSLLGEMVTSLGNIATLLGDVGGVGSPVTSLLI